MAKNKAVLGRGLGALLRGSDMTVEEERVPGDDGNSVGTICAIEIAKVRPNPFQPRLDFNVQALEELKNSILEKGVIQPITVRRTETGFELVSGERRVRASIEAGLIQIPAYILDVNSDREMLELALIENVQRENLNPIEVALGYQRLLRECDLRQEEVADKVGKDRSTVTNFLRLLKLPRQIQESLRANEISTGHARALLTIQDDDQRLEIWEQVRDEGLSVRRTESIVKQIAQTGRARQKPNRSEPVVEKKREEANKELDLTLAEISARLRQVFGTQVKIRSSNSGDGVIQIDFYSSEDLERLLDLFAIIERQNR